MMMTNGMIPAGYLQQGDLSRTARDAQRTNYLVTGASRGIGKGLVSSFLSRPDSIVVACVRDVAAQGPALQSLPKAATSELIVSQLDCASEADPAAAIEALRSAHGLSHLDVVVANAAVAADFGPASTMRLEALRAHIMVNTFSVLLLFQAALPLLRASAGLERRPRFVLIGAPVSTITAMEGCARAPLAAYGVSKLAASYFIRKFHFENEWLVSFVIDPGHVQTDMGEQGSRLMGRAKAPTTIEESVKGVCDRIDEATKHTVSGKFVLHEDGSDVPW